MENEKKQLSIMEKLFEIQKSMRTFAVTEESAKVNTKGKSDYKFTPGWQIVETIREKMDSLKLMLIPNFSLNDIRLIEYPVYKLAGNTPLTFIKKEMHVTVNAKFTWYDVETHEQAGPYELVASGANGTDKSCASAISFAERYFLLKFFHITTHEADDEPDAHDAGIIPGIPKDSQPMPAQPFAPVACPAIGSAFPSATPTASSSAAPAPGYNQPSAAPAPAGPATFDPNHPGIAAAVEKLSHFAFGTTSFQQTLNEVIGQLAPQGFMCFAPGFIENLTECAKAKREGRNPILR